MEFQAHGYQRYLIDRIVDDNASGIGIMIDLGMGKTVIALSAVKRLIDSRRARRVLVLAPAKVAETVWTQEAAKWDHLAGLRVQLLMGNIAAREWQLTLEADVVVVSRDLTSWLVSSYSDRWPFDTVVIDELSGFKDSSTQRFKAVRRVLPQVKRVIGLTGTPMPNDIGDLWAQVYLLDRGLRLGRTVTGFRERYMIHNPYRHDWTAKQGARESIERLISDLCVSMRAEDYLDMPPLVVSDIPIELDEKSLRLYKTLERDYLADYAGVELDAPNAAALAGKLLQLCNGAVYVGENPTEPGVSQPISVPDGARLEYTPEGRKYIVAHDEKLAALMVAIEACQGQAVLVYFQYRHDLARILAKLRAVKGLRFDVLKGAEQVSAWNARRLDVLLAQPQSAGYGLNLQDGGRHMIWFGLPWSLQLYQQATGRLWRQGQTGPVMAHRLIVTGGIDERVAGVLESKGEGQEALLEALRAHVAGTRQNRTI